MQAPMSQPVEGTWSPPLPPPGAPPAKPRPGNVAIFVLFMLASILLVAGAIVLQVESVVPSGSDYNAYVRTLRYMTLISGVLIDLGVFLFLLAGGIIAVFRSDLPEGLRRTALVASVALLIVWLVFFGLFGGIFFSP